VRIQVWACDRPKVGRTRQNLVIRFADSNRLNLGQKWLDARYDVKRLSAAVAYGSWPGVGDVCLGLDCK
jgi:hypothetical protein